MTRVREGLYNIGTIKDDNFQSIIIVNLNNATIVFNNANKGNAASWTNIVKIIDIMKETCKPNHKYINEKWFQLYKKFIQKVPREEYIVMIDKINNGLI